MNVPRIKGSHNAMLSGIHAAEAAFAAIAAGRAHDSLDDYAEAVRAGPIARDLKRVRNAKPMLSRFGTVLGTALSGADMWANTLLPGIGLGYTLGHGKPDHATLAKARRAQPIDYPKPDGVLTFDRLTNVAFSSTNHEEDQPVHLKVADPELQIDSEHDDYGGPSARYCPAGVYEWVEEKGKHARASSSTRRTASTARPAISRTPTRTSTGWCPRAAAGRTTRGCERRATESYPVRAATGSENQSIDGRKSQLRCGT